MNLMTGLKSFLTSWKVEEGCAWTVAQQVAGALQKGQLPSPGGCLLVDSFRQNSASGSSSSVFVEEFRRVYERVGRGRYDAGARHKSDPTANGYTEVEWTYLSRIQSDNGRPVVRKSPGRYQFDMGPQGYTEVEWTYLKSGELGLTGQSIRNVAQSMAGRPAA